MIVSGMIAIVKQTIEKNITNNHRGKINDLNFDMTILINLKYEYESLRSIYCCIQSMAKNDHGGPLFGYERDGWW